jgi:hypothetical protein
MTGSWVSGYLAKSDPNMIDNLSTWATYIYSIIFTLLITCTVIIIILVAFITKTFSLVPAVILLYFVQSLYFTQMASIDYPIFYTEFLSWMNYCMFEFSSLPHIISDYILKEPRNYQYPMRFKRIGLAHHSFILNAECKIEIMFVYFLVCFPLAMFGRIFVKYLLPKRNIMANNQ